MKLGSLKKSAFCLPQGMIGHLGGQLMARDRNLPEWVLNLLEVGPSHSVLDIGFGPGVSIELASAVAREGRVVGVDPSETMHSMARNRNYKALHEGRVELLLGTANALPFDDATFDVALTINCLHLWSDRKAGLQEVKRILRSGGHFAVAFSRFSNVDLNTIKSNLVDAGFYNIFIHTGKGTCVIADKV